MMRGSVTAFVLVLAGVSCTACSRELPGPPAQGTSAYRDQVLADQPSGYWRLDEPSGTVAFDQTMNNNRGAISKGVSPGFSGATGDTDTSMLFDGTHGEIEVPTSTNLQMSGSVTVEAWIKPTSNQSGQVTILGKGRAGVQTDYGLVLVDGVPGYQSVSELYVATAPPVKPGVWTHLAVTVSKNVLVSFYVNGQDAGSFPSNTGHAVSWSMQPVMIANEAALANRFEGGIDEAAIYPFPLTAEQLAKHFALAQQADK